MRTFPTNYFQGAVFSQLPPLARIDSETLKTCPSTPAPRLNRTSLRVLLVVSFKPTRLASARHTNRLRDLTSPPDHKDRCRWRGLEEIFPAVYFPELSPQVTAQKRGRASHKGVATRQTKFRLPWRVQDESAIKILHFLSGLPANSPDTPDCGRASDGRWKTNVYSERRNRE